MSVCLCVCVSVCLCVCICVCLQHGTREGTYVCVFTCFRITWNLAVTCFLLHCDRVVALADPWLEICCLFLLSLPTESRLHSIHRSSGGGRTEKGRGPTLQPQSAKGKRSPAPALRLSGCWLGTPPCLHSTSRKKKSLDGAAWPVTGQDSTPEKQTPSAWAPTNRRIASPSPH